MVRITEEMIRKRPEYSNSVLCTLEDLSLVQEDIENIEFVQDGCSGLQILILQGNMISQIENVHKLKKLEYLNLAINNIERVENLEQCKSLEKLDLSVNFIGDLESVCSLRTNVRLRELYLSGNPCVDFPGYRYYLIYRLPQLQSLDGSIITRVEKITAAEMYDLVKDDIRAEQVKHEDYRNEQRARFADLKKKGVSSDVFWVYQMEHCPEVRLEKARQCQKAKSLKQQKEHINLNKKIPLFAEDGQAINVNQANINFNLVENSEMLELHLKLYKYLESSLVNIELNSIYVRITIQQYIFQYVFPTEVDIENADAQRSKETGHLILRVPKLITHSPISSIASDSPVREELCEWKQTREYLGLDSEHLPHFLKATADKPNKDDNSDYDDLPPSE